jgi:mRNA interferase MazF
MPLSFHPSPGTLLVCDYTTGFRAPEMVKRRPVVVISPRLRHRNNLVAVIPLSTTAPPSILPYHACIQLARPLPKPFDTPVMWAKTDMIATVGFDRLDRFRLPRTGAGRKYEIRQLDDAQLLAVRKALLHGLGFEALIQHL